jgi:fructose PTS system EIIBC or EIIC component
MPIPQAPLIPLAPYLAAERVLFLDDAPDKTDALARMAACVAAAPGISDAAAFQKAIMEREAIGSTGIGHSIAVPHCKLPSISGFVIGIGVAPNGISYGASDGQPVRFMVMIGATDQERRDYLRLLATVAALLKDGKRQEALIASRSADEIIQLLSC